MRAMRYRPLGRTGIRISELFLGAMTFGEQGGVGAPLPVCRSIVDAYADAGGNVIDTAINYRGGQSEEILGEVLEGRPDRFVLASKYTVSRDRTDPNGAGNHRKNLRLSLETSLRRLRTDHLDLYWVHMWDEATPIEETMRALDDAVRSGKVLAIGLSDTPAWVAARGHTLAEAHRETPLAAIQVPLSLVEREVERDQLPMAEALGLTVAAWSPLAGGLLTGKFTRDQPPAASRLDPGSIADADRRVAELVDRTASELGRRPAQVALQWVMSRGPLVHPIIGARTVEQLDENLRALDVELPAEVVRELDDATAIDAGFPQRFIDETAEWVFGAARLERTPGR